MQEGEKAFLDKNYSSAYDYFEQAHLINPTSKDPLYYINFIKRLSEDRVEVFETSPEKVYPTKHKLESKDIQFLTRRQIIESELDGFEKKTNESQMQETVSIPQVPSEPKKIVIAKDESNLNQGPKTIYLDNTLWATQPKTLIQIQLQSYVILEGKNIERFLVITPGMIEAERLDRDHIKISAIKRGLTYLHVWDQTGRWTFNIEVIYQIEEKKTVSEQDVLEQKAKPFRFAYSADWGALYHGQSLETQKRQSLNFLQFAGLYGETPYGDYDSYVLFNKFEESTEATGYSVGLTNGHIFNLKDFTIRGFDNTKKFSPLTVPGQYFRGVLLESDAFYHQFRYSYFRGRDRAIFGFLAPNVLEERQSFVEGLKLTMHPYQDNQYSFNFARGWGEARDIFLKKRVFSVQAQRRINPLLIISGEQAYDENTLARTASARFDKNNSHLRVDLRDIDKDFSTITSLPANRGEAGGIIGFDQSFGQTQWSNYIDLYRDRLLPNEENPSALNLDMSTSLEIPFTTRDYLRSSLYWLDTPGELSPRRNLRINNLYTKLFDLGQRRDLTTFIGTTYQRSRVNFNPDSEYDRYSLLAGFSLPLIENLSYFVNYEYSWVHETASGNDSEPAVLNTGINYLRNLTDFWTLTIGFNYRDEERTESLNSFLAGEDSTIGNIGLTYRPTADFEFYVDGRVRNVWAENERATSYNEVDIRSGVRSAWDLPLRWNPSGKVEGVIYKDLNSNKHQDPGEVGIAHVTVRVGQKNVKTNAQGFYQAKVSAKKVQVSLDIKTLPQGFVFSTPAVVEVAIKQYAVSKVNFGLTTNSGIYGVVYVDLNGDGKPDQDDELISRAKILLDGTASALTDSEGNYFFQDLTPGKHTLTIDVNSLPEKYLPAIKIKNEVNVTEGTTYIFHVPLKKPQSPVAATGS